MLSNQLQAVVSNLTTLAGNEFFNALVLQLQELSQANYLFLAKLNPTTDIASTLAHASHAGLIENFSFSYANGCFTQPDINPIPAAFLSHQHAAAHTLICAPVLNDQHEITGTLVALFGQEPDADQTKQVLSLLQLFSGLASRHMEDTTQQQQPHPSQPNQMIDRVTGLPDRSYLLKQVESAIHTSRSDNTTIALITISLDNFRYINNSLGHLAGDQLLYACARRLEKFIPSGCTLTRIAGDEFGILTGSVCKDSIVDLGLRLLDIIQEPINLEHQPIKLTASIGAATFPEDACSAIDLLAKSDEAAHHRKTSGKNGFSFFTEKLLQENRKKLQLKHALSQALKNRELEVFYQPIINLQSRRLEKCEALVRWTHNGKKIAPLEFIPIAEEFGLAQELGAFVWETACSQIETFKKNGMGNIHISVNRSMAEFPHPSSCNQDWLKTLIGRDIDSSQISFEITETILAPENKSFSEYLSQLKKSGCSISLDDFGTGYSSLSYLRNFPIDYLKIDRSFIHGIDIDPEALALVTSIIEMARALNIKTIAEGVETKGQLTKLDELGCDFIQGFFFSKPIKSDEFIRYSNSFCYDTILQA